MVNVICVKWGDLYSYKFVNRLRYMVDTNTTVPYKFYCLTDDPTDIEDGIEIIPIPKEPKLEVWWNKMFLFKDGLLPEGKYVFFDLDVVIQNNIDEILNYEPDGVSFVKRVWDAEIIDPRWSCSNNSSIIIWKTGQAQYIWDYFMDDVKLTLAKYKGIDLFIHYEGLKYNLLPKEWVYSYLYGAKPLSPPRFVGKYYPEYMVCLFNAVYKELQVGRLKKRSSPYIKQEYIQHMGDYV